MKKCVDCGQEKPMSDYYFNRISNTCFRYCKPCHAVRQNRWIEKNRPKKNAMVKAWKARNRDRIKLAYTATNAVQMAILKGTITRPGACSKCGKACKAEAAHFNYSEPLKIAWLCRSCHRLWDVVPKTLLGSK